MYKIAFGSEARPLKLEPFEISCYILDNRLAVFTLAGIQKALGYDGKSEKWLFDFLNHINKFIPITELLNAIENPLSFEDISKKEVLKGIPTKIFPEIGRIMVQANKSGYLSVIQLQHSRLAEKILQQLNESNVELLVEDATGFKFYKENTIANLEQFLINHLNDPVFYWVRTLPESFFQKLFELNDSNWDDLRTNPKNIGKIIYEIVFARIPADLLETLRSQKPKRSYQRKSYLLQENEHPGLKDYISTVISLIKAAADNWNIFLQLLNRSFPKNPDFTTRFPMITDNKINDEILSPFNKSLRIMS